MPIFAVTRPNDSTKSALCSAYLLDLKIERWLNLPMFIIGATFEESHLVTQQLSHFYFGRGINGRAIAHLKNFLVRGLRKSELIFQIENDFGSAKLDLSDPKVQKYFVDGFEGFARAANNFELRQTGEFDLVTAELIIDSHISANFFGKILKKIQIYLRSISSPDQDVREMLERIEILLRIHRDILENPPGY